MPIMLLLGNAFKILVENNKIKIMLIEHQSGKSTVPRPFVIGLIGHRHLEQSQVPKLQEAFDNYLASILQQLTFTPIIVLTALAEGADRLALTSKFREKISICAVLPMSKEDYIHDFASRHAKSSFLNAVRSCEFLLPLADTSRESRLIGPKRDRAYQRCANWISDNSNSLFAIWDGKNPRGVGGTADTVRYRIRTMGKSSHIDHAGITLHHELASNGVSEPVDFCGCGGHGGMTKEDERDLSDFDFLNSHLVEGNFEELNSSLQSQFELLDHKAINLQKNFISRTKVLLFLGVITINIASIHVSLLLWSSLLATVIPLMLTVILWQSLNKARTKVTYETFRLMAEVLRVQIWWNSCGINKNVLEESTEIREIGDSARLFLSNTLLMSRIAGIGQVQRGEPAINPISWVEEQRNYLGSALVSGAIHRNKTKQRKLKMLIFTLILFAGLVLNIGTLISLSLDSNATLTWTVSLLFTAFLSSAAAIAAFSQVMSYREILSRFQIKEQRLSAALSIMKESRSKAETMQIAKFVGVDALSEAFRWFQLKSDREVRPFQ